MQFIKEVDCEKCVKRNDLSNCDDCIHNYENLPDLFQNI